MDKNSLLAAIDKVPYKSGGTNTAAALKQVSDKMFTGKFINISSRDSHAF